MQDVMDRTQLGGVISRMVVITARCALSESLTPVCAGALASLTKRKPPSTRIGSLSGRCGAAFGAREPAPEVWMRRPTAMQTPCAQDGRAAGLQRGTMLPGPRAGSRVEPLDI